MHENKRLARILKMGSKGMAHALDNPKGALHIHERATGENWTSRWERMFGVVVFMESKKKVSNADNSDSLTNTQARRVRRKQLKRRV